LNSPKAIYVIVGIILWVIASVLVTSSVNTVRARASRPVEILEIQLPDRASLASGDSVFLTSDEGLAHAGEVLDVDREEQVARLALRPGTTTALRQGSQAVVWGTPLSVEEALPALFPPSIQRRIGAQLAVDWEEQRGRLEEAWAPLLSQMAAAYFQEIRDDVEAALDRRADELWKIGKSHGRRLVDAWPRMQAELRPILETHLTPVLGRLMDDAITEAPKVGIAWSIARGRNEEAFQKMLNWLAEFLATISESDRAELEKAIQTTWKYASKDEGLSREVSTWFRGVLEDEALRAVMADVYREAIANNPRTVEFMRERVLNDPEVRKELYALIENLAPTLQRMLAIWLFDPAERTRPEIVHFVRSSALNRRVSWVTLETTNADGGPFVLGTPLPAMLRGSHP
jgi:hypothetical protein